MERADVALSLAVALAQTEKFPQAYRYFGEAARDVPEYSMAFKLFERLCDETSPSERALNRGTDVTGRNDVLRRPGIDLDTPGVIRLAHPTYHEEVRGRLIKLIDRRDVLIEIENKKTGSSRIFLFPFSSIDEVYRGVEAEIVRYDLLQASGWGTYDFHQHLGATTGAPADPGTGETRGYYVYHFTNYTHHWDGRKNTNYKGPAELKGIIWFTAGRDAILGLMRTAGDMSTVDKVVAAWRRSDPTRPAFNVPYTWTRSYAEYVNKAWREHDPEAVYHPIAMTMLHLPGEHGIPYPRYTPTETERSLEQISTFVNVQRAAAAKNRDSGKGKTAELVDLWLRMSDAARQDFVKGGVHTAKIVATLVGTLDLIPYSRESSHVAQGSLASAAPRSPDLSRDSGRTSRSTLIQGSVSHSDGSPVTDELKVRVYPNKWNAASNVTLNLLSAHENIYTKNGRFSKEIVSESDSVAVWIEYGGQDKKYYEGKWESLDLEIVLSKPELTTKK